MDDTEYKELIIRVDERYQHIIQELRSLNQKVSDQNEWIEKKLSDYVTRQEFRPVKAIVYGFVGLVLVSFIGILIQKAMPGSII